MNISKREKAFFAIGFGLAGLPNALFYAFGVFANYALYKNLILLISGSASLILVGFGAYQLLKHQTK